MPFLYNITLAALTDRRHELEFWLPAHGLNNVDIPDITPGSSYLSGFIDLIFRHDNRYYILDWKSNWSPSGDYGRATLDRIIRDHKYDLQYSIYMLALDKFLRMSLTGYDPAIHLGGVCYAFLRGIGDGDNGIYYVPADEINIADVNNDIVERLRAITMEVR
jgi:ATP-dependent exoDNAse (exonuclease V) beta subunit